jgi:hypothetical protein
MWRDHRVERHLRGSRNRVPKAFAPSRQAVVGLDLHEQNRHVGPGLTGKLRRTTGFIRNVDEDRRDRGNLHSQHTV